MNAEHTRGSLHEEQSVDMVSFRVAWYTLQVTVFLSVLCAVNLLSTVTVPLSWLSISVVELFSGTHKISAAGLPAAASHTGMLWLSQYRDSLGGTAKHQEGETCGLLQLAEAVLILYPKGTS